MTSPIKNRDVTGDADLIAGCIRGNQTAWKTFFHRFDKLIGSRVKQVFARNGYRYSDTQLELAMDYVIDHFIFKGALAGFRDSSSLPGFVATVTANATIDWYRTTVTAKLGYGVVESMRPIKDFDFLESAEFGSTESQPPTPDTANPADLTKDERLLYLLLLIRYRPLSTDDVAHLAELSGSRPESIQVALETLLQSLGEKNMASEEKFGQLHLLFVQIQILKGKSGFQPPIDDDGQRRMARKERQYQTLLEAYRKSGFEVFPSRQDLATIMNWEISKVDRIMRLLKSKLHKRLPQEEH